MGERTGIAVLGSTGTIGGYTLDIVDKYPDLFRVVSLAAGKNIEKLRGQIRKHNPLLVSLESPEFLPLLHNEFPEVKFFSGTEGLEACLSPKEIEVAVVGIVGFAGLFPTLCAIEQGKRIALANKESLVVGGSLLTQKLKNSKAQLIPVDSEHSALFQLLEGRDRTEVSSVVLTASGGPLLRKVDLPLEDVTPEIAIKHPNWNMGPKISVDSATLMNKGLEIIEAHMLFGLPSEQIEVWIHPQSIIHGAIWLTDNSCLAQLTRPDMKSSIGYALTYPKRLRGPIEKLTLKDLANLQFLEPDTKRFPALTLARQALACGQSAIIALNAANEVAVNAFLKRQITFPKITELIAQILAKHTKASVTHIEDIVEIDRETRILAEELVK